MNEGSVWPGKSLILIIVLMAATPGESISSATRTLKIMIISAPNKGNTIDQNTQVSAFGTNVHVSWWTNKTGTLMPVFRASNDNGNTFGKTIMLNSTG